MVLSISEISVTEDGARFADAFEVFHRGIIRTLAESGGAVEEPVPAGGAEYRAQAEGLTVSIAVSGESGQERVSRMSHGGAASDAERAVLEQLCGFAVGATPREVVEHGLTYVLERLRDPQAPRPFGGILTPRSAGACFVRPRLLMKALRQAYIAENGPFRGDNDFDRPYSETWLAMAPAAKRALLEDLVQRWRTGAGLAETSMAVFDIDRYDRVIVMFGDDVDVWDKPPHLRALERWLRRETGERIEVFVEVAKDSNRIRRL